MKHLSQPPALSPIEQVRRRSLCWLGVCVLTIPCLAIGLFVLTATCTFLGQFGIAMPSWLHDLLSLGLFAVIILGLGQLGRRWMDARYPDTPVRSASWTDSPGMYQGPNSHKR